MVTQTLESMVTLPDGEKVDVSHFAEYNGYTTSGRYSYLAAKRKWPLFTGTMEAYFEDILGQDWAYIIRIEHELNKQIIENSNIDPDYKLSFLKKEGDHYIFRFEAYIHGQDPGKLDYKIIVKPAISVEVSPFNLS